MGASASAPVTRCTQVVKGTVRGATDQLGLTFPLEEDVDVTGVGIHPTHFLDSVQPAIDGVKDLFGITHDHEHEYEEELTTEGQMHIWTFHHKISKAQREELEMHMELFPERAIEQAFISQKERKVAIDRDLGLFEPPTEMCWHLKFDPVAHDGMCLTRAHDVGESITNAWRNVGFEMIEKGQVGVVILCGGDGSRLTGGERSNNFGFSPVTPAMDLGLISKKSLFQLFAERIRRLQHICNRRRRRIVDDLVLSDPRLARKKGLIGTTGAVLYPKLYPTPVYVMANEENTAEIQQFWMENNWMGISQEYMYFFEQDMFPLVNNHGKILMRNKYQFIPRPNGSGGFYQALLSGGALADMKVRNLEGLFVMNCDNLMAKVLDPVFLGYCRQIDVGVGIKTIERNSWDERLGMCVTKREEYRKHHNDGDNKAIIRRNPMVLEYHEVTDKIRNRKNAERTNFHFYAGDLMQYFLRLDSDLEQTCEQGVGWMSVPIEQQHYSTVKHKIIEPMPDHPNALRMERVLSGIVETKNVVGAFHVNRDEEFAVIRSGKEAVTAVQTLGLVHQAWIRRAGGVFKQEGMVGLSRDMRCEVSPLITYWGEGLEGVFNDSILTLPLNCESGKEHKSAAEVHAYQIPTRHQRRRSGINKLKFGPAESGSMSQLMAQHARIVIDESKRRGGDRAVSPTGGRGSPGSKNSPGGGKNSPTDGKGSPADAYYEQRLDKAFVEIAKREEALPPTPRWLQDKEKHWKEEVKAMYRVYERVIQLERSEVQAETVEALIEELRREKIAEEEEQRDLGYLQKARRPRNRTMLERPHCDEGRDGLRYGVPRYFNQMAVQDLLAENAEEEERRKAGESDSSPRSGSPGSARSPLSPGSGRSPTSPGRRFGGTKGKGKGKLKGKKGKGKGKQASYGSQGSPRSPGPGRRR